MKQQFKSRVTKILAGITTATMTLAFIPSITESARVFADTTKNQENTRLGTSEIAKPSAPEPSTPWEGSYVYFGNYSKKPIKFRVLDPVTTIYGGTTIFLDADKPIYSGGNVATYINDWENCRMRGLLNDEFYNKAFSDPEKNSIALSKIEGGIPYAPGSYEEYMYGKTVGLTGDHIFLLDAADVLNENYGYSSDTGWTTTGNWYYPDIKRHKVINHRKGNWWCLRSSNIQHSDSMGEIDSDGCMVSVQVYDTDGMAPALNIDLSTVIFSSSISGKYGETGASYKLTLLDENLVASISEGKEVTAKDNTVTIPYQIMGKDAENATRVSIMIVDKEYVAGNTNNASILYYDELEKASATEGTFTLPSSLSTDGWGSSYYVYILAEDINDTYETDFASAPIKINSPFPKIQNSTDQNDDMTFDDFVERLYVVALNRQSEKEGKDYWCELVGNGTLTGADCARFFLTSPEFKGRGLSDEEFLKVLYKTFFDRNAVDDPDGFNFWMNSLKSVGKDTVVEGFINSPEWCDICATYGVKSGAPTAKATKASKNATAFATRLYTECLGREPEEGGLKYWSLGLTNCELTGKQAAHEFFYSQEFNDHGYDNKELITRMYKTFMGREPDTDGLNYWLSNMNNGMTKDQVFNSFVQSQEFTEICANYAIDRG
ncbi:MAG: DUF4214 domain-containing protein [Clostridiales bacterium]|nr:DUF4214 domain-containing protein [Clostridiales bacterium]